MEGCVLSNLIENVRKRTITIKAFLLLSDLRDEAIADQENILSAFLRENNFPNIPLQDDRIFRHCAVITHLYGIYEEFVKDSLQLWLTRLPRYARYSQLGSSLKNAYKNGIAQVILNIDRRQFSHIVLLDLVEKYIECLRDSQNWQFVNEAFTMHDLNLRKSELERLFKNVAINNFWSLLQNSRHINNYIECISTDKTLETTLEEFVTYRNEASHGVPDDIFGPNVLKEWVDFTDTICEGIAETIMIKILESEKELNPSCLIGNVVENFRNNIIIAKCRRCELRVGQHLYFLRPNFATMAIIDSLQLNDQDKESVSIGDDETEVGIRTSCEIKRESEVINISV
jgi:hypothetical protein